MQMGKSKGATGSMPSVKGGERYYGGPPPKEGQQRLWSERRTGEERQPLGVSRKHNLQSRWVADEIMTVDNLLTTGEAKELVRSSPTQGPGNPIAYCWCARLGGRCWQLGPEAWARDP